ncbi:type II toxin-antitoxin system Phd/YefM family antitoxin [Nocardia sp. CA-135953]|uniref:type II toxin-antitoxin system Phd/YefM family antitoxin n=1 Tax=Nocardia sp. CA-135953 TaxID=3239978 RepID=UPI003D97641C
MTYTEARAKLAEVLDTATEDMEEVVITRAGHAPAVVIALSEYESLRETAYLLGSPANARRLESAIAAYRAGGGTPRELVDIPDDDDEPAPKPAKKARKAAKAVKSPRARAMKASQ